MDFIVIVLFFIRNPAENSRLQAGELSHRIRKVYGQNFDINVS